MVDNARDIVPGSSQESLPLSQETFAYLWDELQAFPPAYEETLDSSHFDNTVDHTNVYLSEIVSLEPTVVLIPKSEVSSSSIPYVPSSLPASQNWDGPYNFKVSFGAQEKNTKGVTWTYSKLKDKLYVGKDVPCPINFSADTSVPDNVIIRVMALYGSPEHASEIVHRCVNHSLEELNKKIFEAEHLVRCESNMASYKVDPTTKRHSVVVPFEIPPAGQHYSTYIYKFACFGSCAGGPNRRPIMLIFSLEQDGQVMGRRKLDVKICACPGRDCKAEEQLLIPPQEKPLPKKKKASEMTNLGDAFEFSKSIMLPPSKKVKRSHDRHYTLKADDQEQYEFLVQMKKFFKISKIMNNLHPEVKKALSLHILAKNTQDGDSN